MVLRAWEKLWIITCIQSVAMFRLCKGVSAKALPCLWEQTPELLGVCKWWLCGYTSVTAPPVRLGIWHTATGGGDPCSQREGLVGNRQAQEACCRSRGWGLGESERLPNKRVPKQRLEQRLAQKLTAKERGPGVSSGEARAEAVQGAARLVAEQRQVGQSRRVLGGQSVTHSTETAVPNPL